MTKFRLLSLLLAITIAWLFMRPGDPHRTALPFGTTDLSSVQKQLARLPDEERKLVEDYVKRSNGDVLTPKFADPEDPLTARTFAQAIELQKRWAAKQSVADAKAADLKADREARMAPLRDIVEARVVSAKVMTLNEFQQLSDPDYARKAHQVSDATTFVLRVRVENHGSQPILALKGALQARDRDAYLPMDLCWIDLQQEIPSGESSEFYCGNRARQANDQQRAYADHAEGRFTEEWQPQYLKLASGRELDAGR
jgi:hypothetical protein